MPNVLSLKRKIDGKVFQGSGLVQVDEFMCDVLGVDSHPVNFYNGWVDRIGFSLALGQSYTDCRKRYDDPADVQILDYLETYYEPACYYAR